MEFQINDRLTFIRFLGLSLGDNIPDQNTIWSFRENLINKGVNDRIKQGEITEGWENKPN